MRVLYLFNRVKQKEIESVKKKEDHDGHFFGMLRLPNYGIDAGYLELEQYVPKRVAGFLRRHVLNIHFAHMPLVPLFFKYDILFTSTAFGPFFLRTLLGVKRPKWVLFDYNLTGLMGTRKTIKQKILYYLVSRSDGIITISQSEKDVLCALFPDKKIEFVPLGVDTEFFYPKDTPEENFILSPGRDPGRDFKTLFEAVKDLDVEVKITAHSHQLKKFGTFPKNVTVHDFSPRELVAEYAKAKMVILPLAVPEGQEHNAMGCSTLVEAMAMGKPVVATKTNTVESYIKNNVNGILVVPGDTHALREAIEKLLRSKDERIKLGERARTDIAEHSSADLFARNLAEFFKTL